MIPAKEVYRLQSTIRHFAQQLTFAQATALTKRILTDARFPQAEYAEAVPHPSMFGKSSVAWDVGTTPATPLVALAQDMCDELTVIHECAHILRNGPSYAGRKGNAEIAHDVHWAQTFKRLIARYATDRLARPFRVTFLHVGARTSTKVPGLSIEVRGPGSGHLVAWMEGKVVGQLIWVGGTPNTNRFRRGEVIDLRVDPEYQRMGIATAMWEYAQTMDVPPVHSENLTDEGKAWTRSLGARGPLTGGTIYRGLRASFPPEIDKQIQDLLAPETDKESYARWKPYGGKKVQAGEIIVRALEKSHWDSEMGLGRHWSTRREMAEIGAQQGGRGNWAILLEATYTAADVDPDWDPDAPFMEAESEVRIRPGARLTITEVDILNSNGFFQSKGKRVSYQPIQARATKTAAVTFTHLRNHHAGDDGPEPTDRAIDTLVAREGGRDIGWISWMTGGGLTHGGVDALYVDPAHRRQGLATRLLAKAREIEPNVNPHNTPWLTDDGKAWLDAIGARKVAWTPFRPPPGIRITTGGDAVPDGYNGYYVAWDAATGEKMGYLDYQSAYWDEEDGTRQREVKIAMVEVEPKHRRKGVATVLLQALKHDFPDAEIDPGYTTPEGAAWWRRVASTVTTRTAGKRGMWWRVHPEGRAFGPWDATSKPFYNHPDAVPQQGYSCFENPWHLYLYVLVQWAGLYDGTTVLRFPGERVGTGHDGEDLAVPTGLPFKTTWGDFCRMLPEHPLPRTPVFAPWVASRMEFRSWKALAERWKYLDQELPEQDFIINKFAGNPDRVGV